MVLARSSCGATGSGVLGLSGAISSVVDVRLGPCEVVRCLAVLVACFVV